MRRSQAGASIGPRFRCAAYCCGGHDLAAPIDTTHGTKDLVHFDVFIPDNVDAFLALLQDQSNELGNATNAIGRYRTFRDGAGLTDAEDGHERGQTALRLLPCGLLASR